MDKHIKYFKFKLIVLAMVLIFGLNILTLIYLPKVSTFNEFVYYLLFMFNQVFLLLIFLTIYLLGRLKTIEENQEELQYLNKGDKK